MSKMQQALLFFLTWCIFKKTMSKNMCHGHNAAYFYSEHGALIRGVYDAYFVVEYANIMQQNTCKKSCVHTA